jgi:hypothetical protein
MSTRLARGLGLRSDEADRALFLSLSWLAAAAVAARLLASVFVNVPATPSRAPLSLLAAAGTALAALALVAAGVRTGGSRAGVGLLFAGVFGALSAVSPAATVPGAVAVTAGTALFLSTRRDRFGPASGAVTALFVSALALGLGGALTGAATLRPIASTLAFLSLAGTPVFVTPHRRSLVRAGLAFAVVVAVGLSLPYVTGAVTLVGTGAVGTSLPVIALAAAGTVTTASAALRERRWLLLAGVVLVAAGGVPATIDRALPFVLALVALVSQGGPE